VCDGEDDGQDEHDTDENRGVSNKVSLAEGRANFCEFGASDSRRASQLRPPEKSELDPLQAYANLARSLVRGILPAASSAAASHPRSSSGVF
jgi:hypothetical protein